MLLFPVCITAQTNMYHMEVGVHGGGGYYVGELAPHVFMSSQLAYGAHFRYKFDNRWAAKAQGVLMCGRRDINPAIWNFDVTVDFNFFDFGERDYYIGQICPFIFAGAGCSLFSADTLKNDSMIKDSIVVASPYIPFGVGIKWKFHDRMQLQFAWQHNAYIWNGDCIEGKKYDYPTIKEEGKKNILNNDVTSTFTLTYIIEFMRHRPKNKNIRF